MSDAQAFNHDEMPFAASGTRPLTLGAVKARHREARLTRAKWESGWRPEPAHTGPVVETSAPAVPYLPPSGDPELDRERRTALLREAARRDARKALDAASSAEERLVSPVWASELQDVPVAWRVDQVLPEKTKTTIIARAKTGKTTFTLNLVASLTTGVPFLGEYAAEPLSGAVGYLNFELEDGKFRREAESIGANMEKLRVWSGRQGANPFNNPVQRERLVTDFQDHGVEVLIIDPLSNAFPRGADQNSTSDMRDFLTEAESLMADCGASEVGGRYSALGATRLSFDEVTHRLTADQPTSEESVLDVLDDLSDYDRVFRAVEEHPGATTSELGTHAGMKADKFRTVVRQMRREHADDPDGSRIVVSPGKRNAVHFFTREDWELPTEDESDPAE